VKVTFVHNATVIIETPDLKVLCDPWFTPAAYDGSWHHWPLTEDRVPQVDAIWISHVHPDHYDPAWLRGYLTKYPDTHLLCGKHAPPILETVMRADGFEPMVIDHAAIGLTELHCIPHQGWDCDNIDSTLVVKHGNESVVNVNDCPADDQLADAILTVAPNPTCALLPFAGAGPWPQTFLNVPKPVMAAAARGREAAFLGQFCEWRELLAPRLTVPFAGQYALGGENSHLNKHRGIPDATVLNVLESTVVLVEYGTLDLSKEHADGLRVARLDPPPVIDGPMAWSEDTDVCTADMLLAAVDGVSVPVPPLAIQTGEFRLDLAAAPLGTLHVDGRYLHGLLTGKYAWDNAITGSNVRFSGSGQLVAKPFRNFYNRLRLHGIEDQQG
jgi:hypothetical protein